MITLNNKYLFQVTWRSKLSENVLLTCDIFCIIAVITSETKLLKSPCLTGFFFNESINHENSLITFISWNVGKDKLALYLVAESNNCSPLSTK